jgi:hypothetical protein
VTVEEQLAAALATVPGLDPKPYRPGVITPMAAWPEWSGAMPLTDCTFDETFDVLVVLPSGAPAKTASTRRSLIAAVSNALSGAGAYITGSGPVVITLDQGSAGPPGLRVSIRITTQEDT